MQLRHYTAHCEVQIRIHQYCKFTLGSITYTFSATSSILIGIYCECISRNIAMHIELVLAAYCNSELLHTMKFTYCDDLKEHTAILDSTILHSAHYRTEHTLYTYISHVSHGTLYSVHCD